MESKAVVAVLLVSALASRSEAGEHLVTAEQVRTSLTEQAQQRTAQLARLDALLATPTALELRLPESSLARARAVLPTLDDAELADLSARSQALQLDPASGGVATRVAVAFLVVLVVFYLVVAVAAGCVGNSQCLT